MSRALDAYGIEQGNALVHNAASADAKMDVAYADQYKSLLMHFWTRMQSLIVS